MNSAAENVLIERERELIDLIGKHVATSTLPGVQVASSVLKIPLKKQDDVGFYEASLEVVVEYRWKVSARLIPKDDSGATIDFNKSGVCDSFESAKSSGVASLVEKIIEHQNSIAKEC